MVAKRKISDEPEFEEIHNEEDIELGVAAVIIPPDGGWGWVVVFASFLANMIVDGIIFTAGQAFQPAWIEDYKGTTEGAAAWVVSLLSGCYLLVDIYGFLMNSKYDRICMEYYNELWDSGPIASSLVNIFGCRRVCIGGTLLAFLGFLLSCFAPSIGFLYVTFGIMGGIGFGFVFLPSVVIVSYYFERRRATATGISLCGSGIGTFVFAPFIKFLLETYPHWSQALLIITGITLNGLICGSLYRSLTPTRAQIMTLEEKLKAIDEELEEDDITHKNNAVNGDATVKAKVDERGHEATPKESHHLLAANVPFERFETNSSQGRQPIVQQDASRGSLRKRTISDRSFRSLFDGNPASASPKPNRIRGISLSIRVDGAEGDATAEAYKRISRDGVNVLNRPLSRQDIFYPGSVRNLPEFKSQPDVPHYIASTISIPTLVGAEGAGADGGLIIATGVKETIKATLRSMLDVTLLKDPSFLILAFSGFFTLTGFFVPFIYLPRQAMAVGHSKDSATFLISILGITNIVARLLCGWLSDRPQVNALMLNNVALMLAGLATISLPHLQSYWMLCIYCVVFGTGTACFASLRSIICVELLGLEKLTNAFGLLLLFMGLASLVGSPIAGMLYDKTGSFTVSFYVMGILITLSGAMGVPLYVATCLKRRKERKYKVELHPPEVVIDEATELTATPRVQIPERVPEADEETEHVA